MNLDFSFFFNSILLGVGLAMDAFSVSLANGLNEPGMKKAKMCGVAGLFSFFQFAMPMIGWICVSTIAGYFSAFEKFIKEHHISWERFCECLPSPEIILKDKMELKEVGKRAKDCWGVCTPITFQMLEDYLDGDEELAHYDEQPSYYISTYGGKTDTTFTKTDFLKSIRKEQQKIKTQKARPDLWEKYIQK